MWSANNILSTNDQIRTVLRITLKFHREVLPQVINSRRTTMVYMWPTIAEHRVLEAVKIMGIARKKLLFCYCFFLVFVVSPVKIMSMVNKLRFRRT